MPSPVAHLATALAIYTFLGEKEHDRQEAPAMSGVMIASLLPDADTIPGYLFGRMSTYHNNISHSLCLSLGSATLLVRCLGLSRPNRHAVLAAVISHLLLDGLGSRRGLMLFWPFSRRRFSGGWRYFRGFRWHAPLYSREHRQTLRNELPYSLLLVGLALLGRWARRRHWTGR